MDVPSVPLTKAEYDEMRLEPNAQKTAKHLGLLPIFKGMEMIPTESYLPPQYVRGSPCKVVGLQLHEHEPPIEGRDSLLLHGFVLLQYMPKCVYVKLDDTVDTFMPPPSICAAQPDVGAPPPNMKGVMAIEPKSRQWTFKSSKLKH